MKCGHSAGKLRIESAIQGMLGVKSVNEEKLGVKNVHSSGKLEVKSEHSSVRLGVQSEGRQAVQCNTLIKLILHIKKYIISLWSDLDIIMEAGQYT